MSVCFCVPHVWLFLFLLIYDGIFFCRALEQSRDTTRPRLSTAPGQPRFYWRDWKQQKRDPRGIWSLTQTTIEVQPPPEFHFQAFSVPEFWFWPISSKTIDLARIFEISIAKNAIIGLSNYQITPNPHTQTAWGKEKKRSIPYWSSKLCS